MMIVSIGASAAAVAWAEPMPPPRFEPVGDLNPNVVSKRLLRSLASGAWPLERFVDPGRGLVVFHYESYDTGKQSFRTRHYCADTLKPQLKKLRQELVRQVEDEHGFYCENRPLPNCSAGGGEFEPTIHFRFTSGPKGLVLESVSYVSEKERGYEEAAERALAREMARTEPCKP